MIDPSHTAFDNIYQRLCRYIPRSFDGEPYAVEMVAKLHEIAMKSDPNIYFRAIEDTEAVLRKYDERLLGMSVNKFYRVKYTPKSQLDDFFELFRNKVNDSEKFRFDEFCKYHGLNPDNIILFPIIGFSMKDAGILEGDTAVVDISETPQVGDVAAVSVNGKYFIKRIGSVGGKLLLVSENVDFKPYTIGPADDFKFIGLVTNIIKQIKRK